MIKAACHCGSVRFEVEAPPQWVLDCNCTLCRRYGALWAYPHAGQANVLKAPDPGVTETYSWGDRDLAFHRCRACGCITHMEAINTDPPTLFGLNARMMLGLDPSQVSLRQVDNGHSGFFWTRSSEPVRPSRHPPMPPPGPDDWR
jgi:hypothetical protein